MSLSLSLQTPCDPQPAPSMGPPEPQLWGAAASPSPRSLTPLCASRLLDVLKLPGWVKASNGCRWRSTSHAGCCLGISVLGQCHSTEYFWWWWEFQLQIPAVAGEHGSAARSEVLLGQQKGLDVLLQLQL